MEEQIKKQEEEFDKCWRFNFSDSEAFISSKARIKKLIDKVRKETSEFEKDQLRQKLRQAIKQCHGGGNGRRLLEEVLNDI